MTSTKTIPAVDNDDTTARVGPMHQAFADFLNQQHGAGGITAEQVFLVTSKRKAFRSTDAYRVGVKAAQEQAKAAELAEKEKRAQERAAAKAQREADRKAAAEEKAAAAAAEKAKAAEPAVQTPAPKATAKPATKKATTTKATPAKTA